MPGLKHTLAAMPPGNMRLVYGTAYWDGTEWLADVGGEKPIACRWNDPLQPVQGGQIVVAISNDGPGQHSAFVIGGYTAQPRPSTGTVNSVIPAGVSTQIAFTGDDGVAYVTDQFVGEYNPGDPVYLSWDATKPTILGKVGAIATPKPPQATSDDPAPTTRGKVTRVATRSDTWGVGGWGRWATSQGGGQDVYSGTWAGYTMTGAWFYGTKSQLLTGKTITKALFRLPQRLGVGSSGSAVVHIYGHPHTSQPGTDVTRTVGPFDVTRAQNQGAGWVELPSTFYSILANGGGISIAGDPYTGFRGRRTDPESGKIVLEWSS